MSNQIILKQEDLPGNTSVSPKLGQKPIDKFGKPTICAYCKDSSHVMANCERLKKGKLED